MEEYVCVKSMLIPDTDATGEFNGNHTAINYGDTIVILGERIKGIIFRLQPGRSHSCRCFYMEKKMFQYYFRKKVDVIGSRQDRFW